MTGCASKIAENYSVSALMNSALGKRSVDSYLIYYIRLCSRSQSTTSESLTMTDTAKRVDKNDIFRKRPPK